MGRKIKEGGKYPCRFGCGLVYSSKSGRRGHEIKKHGSTYGKRDIKPPEKEDYNEPKDTDSENVKDTEYVKITEVKFMAPKIKTPKGKEDPEHKCGKCSAEWSGQAKYCPECGVEFE